MAKRSHTTPVMDIRTRDRLNFIDGSLEIGASGETFENHSPVDGHLLGIVHEAGREDVDRAVRAAKAALSGPWGKLNITDRVELLYGVAAAIDMRFDDFLAAEVEDTGKPRSLASHLDIPRGAANFKIFADIVKIVGSEFFETPTPDASGDQLRVATAAFTHWSSIPNSRTSV